MSKFKKGDYVYLSENSKWSDGTMHNPLNKRGEVIGEYYGTYQVMWDGRIENGAYTDECLIPESDREKKVKRLYKSSLDYQQYEVNDE